MWGSQILAVELTLSQPGHTDLNDASVKKSLLHQNELYLNKKGLEFIIRYSPSPFLSA